MARRTAVYLRISKDGEHSGLGIERQRSAVTDLARAKGWRIDPAWVIEENDVSATKKRPRPGFERLLRGMADGEVEAVLAYAVDRLVRRLDDLTRLIETAEEYAVPVATVAGDMDLSTGHGRGLAKLLGVVASIETDNMGERMRRRKWQNAQAGVLRSGGRRPYGFTANRAETVDSEAKVIREVTERALRGEALSGIASDLNRRGVPTSYDTLWTLPRLQRTLSRPALCGRVTYKGEVVRDADGQPVRGEWTPILTDEEFDELQVAIAARRRHPAEWTQNRRHLLSGIVRCGICSTKMIGFRQTNGSWCYVCAKQRHLSRQQDLVEEYVIDQVTQRAAETSVKIETWSDEEGQQVRKEINALERRKYDAAREFADGSIPTDLLRRIVTDLEERIADLRDSQVEESVNLQHVDAVSFKFEGWENAVLPEKRAAILMYVEKIVILPAGRGRTTFNPDLVDIHWRDVNRLTWHAVVEH